MTDTQTRLNTAYADALATRGRNKGRLKAKCPPMGTDAAIMWQALMIHANPYKCGMGHLSFAYWSDPEFKAACGQFANDMIDRLPALDKDRVALTRLGVW